MLPAGGKPAPGRPAHPGRAVARPAAPLAVVEIAPGVFVHPGRHEDFTPENLGRIANLGFVIGGRSVAVIDTGGSLAQGQELLAAIRARTPLPISHVVNTHVHPDHLLGNAALGDQGVVIAGHAKLAGRLAAAGPFYLANLRRLIGPAFAGSELVPPSLGVVGAVEVDLGGRTLELRAWPTAHTDTDLTALDRASGSLLGWLAALDALARLPARRVVPGHGLASAPWPEALAEERRYLEGLRDGVRTALRRNRRPDQAVAEIPLPPGQDWLLAEENHPRNVTAAYTELEWE